MRAEAQPIYATHNSQTECGGAMHENDNRVFQKGKMRLIQLIMPSLFGTRVELVKGYR